MLPGPLYQPIYLAIVAIFTCFILLSNSDIYRYGRIVKGNGAIIALIFILFIGLRPADFCFVDMMTYAYWFKHPSITTFTFNWSAENFLFDNILDWFVIVVKNQRLFFLFIAIIYFGGAWFACSKIFPKYTLLAFLTFLASFSTFSYGTNGIKAGAAASMFLVAVAYYREKYKALCFLIISLGFHHSMLMPILAYIAAFRLPRPKIYFYCWIVCVVVALLHIQWIQSLFADMADDRGAQYLTNTSENWGGKTGFRIDFLLYSAVPIAIAYWALFKRKIRSSFYNFLISLYLMSNSVWVLCMYVTFNNRIAYLSWCLYPIVMIYPFLKVNLGIQGSAYAKYAIMFNLLFTLFMDIIYY